MNCRVRVRSEEMVNIGTHAVGVVASLAALPVLVHLAAQRGDMLLVGGVLIFAISLVCVYSASTMYHAVRPGPAKDFWLRADYAANYLLIAGTYTPFTLGALRGPWGYSLLIVVWVGALVGIYEKLRLQQRNPIVTALPYLALGWLAVVAIDPFLDAIGWAGFRWLLAGGLAYTIGVAFFACDRRLKFGHCVWHVFVLAGSACHVIAVTAYGVRLPH